MPPNYHRMSYRKRLHVSNVIALRLSSLTDEGPIQEHMSPPTQDISLHCSLRNLTADFEGKKMTNSLKIIKK